MSYGNCVKFQKRVGWRPTYEPDVTTIVLIHQEILSQKWRFCQKLKLFTNNPAGTSWIKDLETTLYQR